MKKTLRSVISIILVISMLVIPIPLASAASSATIAVESKAVMRGSKLEIKVSVENNSGFAYLGATPIIPAGFELVKIVNGDMISDFTAGKNYVWINDKNVSGNGTLMTFEFNVPDTVEPGSYTVGLNIRECCDADENYLSCTSVAGTILVTDIMYGDANGDGEINGTDLVRLKKYIAGMDYDTGISDVEVTVGADATGDGEINGTDLVRLKKYIAGYDYDTGKSDVILGPTIIPPTPPTPPVTGCTHSMSATAAKAATCTEAGNTAYWHCSVCDKYFSDENGKTEITLASTIINAKGHTYSNTWSYDATYHWHAATCGHTNLVKDKAEHNYGSDNICDICSATNIVNPTKPYEITYELYEYNENEGDTYLPTAYIDNSKNRTSYSSVDSFDLENPTCAGYKFEGWFTIDGKQITHVDAGTNKNLRLQARWSVLEYEITYRLFKTPVEDNIKEEYKSYTVNKGLVDMPNPDIYNYIFLGWYTDDGVEVTNIPVGTTGNIALNAFFVSKRNMAKPVSALGDPIIVEDTDEGVIYFAYELGTIENVPLDVLRTYDNIVGLTQIASEEYTWSVSNTRGEQITDTISKSTIDSGTWSWSENWSDVLEVNEEWAKEHGMTQSEAKEAIKTTTDGFSTTHSEGGQKNKITTDGTTTLTYDSVNEKNTTNFGTHAEIGVSASAGYSVGAAKGEFEASVSGGVEYKNGEESDKHTGTDITDIDTTVEEEKSSWNDDTKSEHSEENSTSETITNALSEIISNTKGYGKSYAKGGEGSKSFDSSTSESKTSSASSTVTFTSTETQTTTTTVEIDATTMKSGSYRLTIGGTMHVYAIVGYDIANKSYFHYTYNIMDDNVKTFFDYSCDNSFEDHEYSVLPFEIPYFVNEYVSSKIAVTDGVKYKTDSTTGTATILQYLGDSTDVLIPTYISAGGTAYKVTKISASAFAGNTSIRTVILSEYIDEIPAGAFKGCTALKNISGYYTKIGNEAFSGCTALDEFTISSAVTQIGTDAFVGVGKINVNVLSSDNAVLAATGTSTEKFTNAKILTQNIINAAVNSGADAVVLDISKIIYRSKFNIEVPEITYFELNGGKKTYNDLTMVSHAQTTKLSDIVIQNSSGCSIDIGSKDVMFNAVAITSAGTSLALSCDGVKVSLYKDTRFVSNSGTAIVCKNATFDTKTVDGVIGTLDVSGNIYVVGASGNVTDSKCPYFVSVENGKVIAIEKDQFDSYVKGTYIIYFNPNGGTVSIDHKKVNASQAIGTLPTPTRAGYTFDGWYAYDKKYTEDTVYNLTSDITLTAKWTEIYAVSISFVNIPKREYYVGDKMDASGLVLKVTYNDGTSKNVSYPDVTVSAPDMTSEGEKWVTVSYAGVSNSYVILVLPLTISISVDESTAQYGYILLSASVPCGNVTWTSSNTDIAYVTPTEGLSTAVPFYDTFGVTTITATVNNNGCTASATKTITLSNTSGTKYKETSSSATQNILYGARPEGYSTAITMRNTIPSYYTSASDITDNSVPTATGRVDTTYTNAGISGYIYYHFMYSRSNTDAYNEDVIINYELEKRYVQNYTNKFDYFASPYGSQFYSQTDYPEYYINDKYKTPYYAQYWANEDKKAGHTWYVVEGISGAYAASYYRFPLYNYTKTTTTYTYHYYTVS